MQGPTLIQFDNAVANGIITDTVVQRRSKATDLLFYCLRDRFQQKQFHVHWKQVKNNLADYPSKHHSTQHHISVRPTYVLNTIKKIYLNDQNYQRHCKRIQIHYPPTVEQLTNYKYPMPTVSISSLLNQRRHLKPQPFYLSETDCPNPSY